MTNVQHIIENVQFGNGCMAEVSEYGEGIHTDLEGALNLEDMATNVGGALARLDGILGPDGLTVNYEDAMRANAETKDAELAYLTAGCAESSDPHAATTVEIPRLVEGVTSAAAEKLLSMKADIEIALAGLLAAKKALDAYEAKRVVLVAEAETGIVVSSRVTIEAGEAYIATLGGAPDAT